MRTDFPFMQLPVADFGADTATMSTTETGAYILLLVAMWRAGGVLPDDDKKLARYAHLTAGQWLRVKPAMMEKFRIDQGYLTSSTLSRMLEAVRRRSSAGKRGADSKWLKYKAPSDATAVRSQSDRYANQIRKITTTSVEAAREEEGEREETEIAAPAAKQRTRARPQSGDGNDEIEVSDRLAHHRLTRAS